MNSDIKYKEDEIADCICALAEQLSRFEDTKNIKSESVDGYSVTYSDNLNKTLRETLKIYLSVRYGATLEITHRYITTGKVICNII